MKKPQFLSNTGLRLGVSTVIASAILDQEQNEFPSGHLYAEAWTTILLNLLVVGPFMYERVRGFASVTPKSMFKKIFETFSLVSIHSLIYGGIHRCMHKIRSMRPIHKFHHRFNGNKQNRCELYEPPVPSVANAVSVSEFILAYMMPFAVGLFLTKANESSFIASISIISALNLCVHSNNLKDKEWSKFLVSPKDHLDHHKYRSTKYFAPTWNLNF